MHHFRLKTAMATFWATFGITLAIFILTSGHTVRFSLSLFCARDRQREKEQEGERKKEPATDS